MLVEYAILFFSFMIMVSFYMRFKNIFRAMFIGSFSGLLAFVFCGYFLQSYIRFNMFTVLMSLINGIPGVIFIILFKRFC